MLTIIDCPTSADFAVLQAECKRSGWRIITLKRGKTNASWIAEVDKPERPESAQPELEMDSETRARPPAQENY